MTQNLIAKVHHFGMADDIIQLQHLDAKLMALISECKMSQLTNEQQ